MIINREEERELMKNYPEWEVGTYFREPVYITLQNQFIEPSYFEFMAHAALIHSDERATRKFFS